jgi:hypothetical protein
LNSKVNLLEQDKFNIAKMKDQTIDILNKELNRGVNINYLRNVIISFLTSDKDSVYNKIINKIYLNIYFIQLFL